MDNLILSKPRNVGYFGRRAKVWTLQRGANPHTERVVITEWIDPADERNGGHKAGTIVARHCTGDGQTPDFVQHAEEVFSGVHASDVAGAWAIERMTGVSIDGAPIDCTPPSGC